MNKAFGYCIKIILGLILFSMVLNGQTITMPTSLTADTTGYVLLSSSGTTPAVSGFSTDLKVVISVTNGTIRINTTTGLTAPSGYTEGQWAGNSEIAFEGSQAEVNDALATLGYQGGAVGSTTLSVSAVPTGAAYNPDNGHYYQYVSASVTWADALSAAGATTYNGLTGYLATITSSQENSFIVAKVGSNEVWMGASDINSEGVWIWEAGPENGIQFWAGDGATGSAVSGAFTLWQDLGWTIEPNGGTGENCLELTVNGRWNDHPPTELHNYVVEYGGMGGTATVQANTDLTIVSTQNPPSLVSSNPADNSIDIEPNANIVLTFSEAVDVESGEIHIRLSSDNSLVESIAVTSGQVTGSGSTDITINPTSDFALSTGYYVQIDTNAFDDASGASYAGISDTTSLNFTSRDPVVATLSTTAVSAISYTTASSGGNITDNGGASVTARGVCWSTSTNPIATGDHTIDSTGTGSFTSSITGLNPSTTYFVRAYATNSAGTSYGNELSFTTLTPSPEMSLSQGATPIADGGSQDFGNQLLASNTDLVFTITNSGAANLTLTTPITISGTNADQFSVQGQPTSPVSTGGGTTTFTIRFTPTTAGAKTASIAIANNDADENPYNLTITGTGVAAPTATTDAATGVSTTGATLNGTINANNQSTTVTFEYGLTTSYGSTVTATPGIVTGITDTSVSYLLTGLSPNTLYHYRVLGQNGSGTTSGSDMTFTTGGGLADVQTTQISGITSSTAIGGGIVRDDGGIRVNSRGICWSTIINPNITNPHTVNGSGTGNFSSSIKDLAEGTTYYVRAYAENNIGISYGQNVTFTSLGTFPEILITNPVNEEIISGTIKIKADSSLIVDPVDFYIDNTLLGSGTISSVSDINKNSINTTFNIDNSDYLFIDADKQLKKISFNGNINNVFDQDINVDDISMNSIGEVFISLSESINLYGNIYKFIKIDTINKTVYGIDKPEISERKESIVIKEETTGNYSISTGLDNESRTIVFVKERPVKVIKNNILVPYKLSSSTVLNFTTPIEKDEVKSNTVYSIDWNTLNNIDGIHTIKVIAQDEHSRLFSDEIELLIRNFKINLEAIRKEDRAYTFKIHFAELIFKIENPKNLPVVKYAVFRSIAGSSYESITEIDASTLIDNTYTYYDKNIDKNVNYTYKIVAYNSAGNILSESEIKSI